MISFRRQQQKQQQQQPPCQRHSLTHTLNLICDTTRYEIQLFLIDTQFTQQQTTTTNKQQHLYLLEHFLPVVHDSHGRIFRKDDEVHPWQSNLDTLDDVTDLFSIRHNFLVGVQAWHGVLEDTDTDRVVRRGDL